MEDTRKKARNASSKSDKKKMATRMGILVPFDTNEPVREVELKRNELLPSMAKHIHAAYGTMEKYPPMDMMSEIRCRDGSVYKLELWVDEYGRIDLLDQPVVDKRNRRATRITHPLAETQARYVYGDAIFLRAHGSDLLRSDWKALKEALIQDEQLAQDNVDADEKYRRKEKWPSLMNAWDVQGLAYESGDHTVGFFTAPFPVTTDAGPTQTQPAPPLDQPSTTPASTAATATTTTQTPVIARNKKKQSALLQNTGDGEEESESHEMSDESSQKAKKRRKSSVKMIESSKKRKKNE